MITHAEWRNLIYQLSENFPQCALLNFAIQQICESGNYLNEIVSVATSASSYRVFHRVITDTISNMMQMDELSFATTVQDFKKICCFSQYTYMYAQALLATLAMNAHDLKNVPSQENFFLRLMEELEEYILKQEDKNQNEGWIRKLRYLFMEQNLLLHHMVPSADGTSDAEDSLKLFEVTFTIMTILLSHSSTPGDVNKLYKYFSKNQNLIILLQHPHVLDILIGDLFDPSKKEMDSNYLSKYIYLLSSATISSPSLLESTSQALLNCIPMCSNKVASTITLVKTVTQLRANIAYNIVCIGILHWMGLLFSNSDYFISTYQVHNSKLLMALLQEMALYHPSLHNKILECLIEWYDVRAYSTSTHGNHMDELEKKEAERLDPLIEIEIKKQFLSTMIYLICIGYAIPTIRAMQSLIHESQMDYSLIRYFLNTLWEHVSQDSISKDIQTELTLLMAHSRVQLALGEVNAQPLRQSK